MRRLYDKKMCTVVEEEKTLIGQYTYTTAEQKTDRMMHPRGRGESSVTGKCTVVEKEKAL
jgi:hypothetical protein